MTTPFSRRRLFTHVAGGASALVVSHGLLGSALAAPSKEELMRKGKARRPKASEDGPQLSREELALARALSGKCRHAIASAAAQPDTAFAGGSLAAVAARFITKQPQARRNRAKDRARRLFDAPTAERKTKFGGLADEKPERHKEKRREKDVDDSARKVKAKHRKENDDGPVFERIEFHLNWIDCVEETNETSESDEIVMMGQFINPSGDMDAIRPFKMEEFDAGDTSNYDYSPCKALPSVPPLLESLCPNGGPNDPFRGRVLGKAKLTPGTYMLMLTLAEEDSGDAIAEFARDLYKSMEPEIDKALTAGATYFAGPFGPAIAWALGEALDFLVEEIFDSEDDFIAMRFFRITIRNRSVSGARRDAKHPLDVPKGVWASSMQRLRFVGDGGRYDVGLHWRVLK